jgi:hypothetical protein
MAVPRAASATTVFPSAVSSSQQDFLVIGGNNKGLNYYNIMIFYKYTFKYFLPFFGVPHSPTFILLFSCM